MASTPQQILNHELGTSEETLYTAFVGGSATRAMLVSLDVTNKSAAEVTVDIYVENAAGSTEYRFADDLPVPAKSTVSWRGMITLDAASETIKALASAGSAIDIVGTVIENA